MEKRRFRFNILDFLVLIVVVLCIVGAVLRGYTKTTDEKLEVDKAIITFKINNIQEASAQYFAEGTEVYSYSLGCDLGKMVGEVEVSPAVYYVEHDGKIVKAYSDTGRIDLIGKIECEGPMTKDGGFKLDGSQYFAPGMTTSASLPQIDANILITDIKMK